MNDNDSKPWYKEPWPFILISITGLGVVAGSTLAFIGLSNPPDLVRGEFEQLGRGLTDVGARTAQARELGLTGRLRVDGHDIRVEMSALDAGALPEQLLVQFEHPLVADRDAIAMLTRGDNGDYTGSLGEVPHERSRIVIGDLPQTWWLAGRLDESGSGGAELAPKRL